VLGLFKVELSGLSISLGIARSKIMLIRSEMVGLSLTSALLVAYK